MGRLKLPKINSGDLLDSEVWNEHFNEQIDNFKIGSENIAEEGINKNKVRSGVFLNRSGFRVSSSSHDISAPDGATGSLTRDPFIVSNQHFVEKSLVRTGRNFTDDGTQVIARASAEVEMPDYGARTFFPGENATAILGLFYTFDSSPSKDSNWRYCQGTKGLFSLVFSSKIPSDSGGGLWMAAGMEDVGYSSPVSHRKIEDRPDLFTMEPADFLGMPDGTGSYDITGNSKMPFDGRFSYSTAFLLNFDDVDTSIFTPTTVSGVQQFEKLSFCIGGSYFIPDFLGTEYPGDSTAGDVGYPIDYYGRGCGKVIYTPIKIRNIQTSYSILER
jgi:hypothetical protein